MIKSRRIGWAGNGARMEAKRNTYMILVGKPEGNTTCRWDHDIKMDPREIGWGSMDWIDLAQDRDQWRAFVNMVINSGVP
jgi:hypothetical protein